MGFLKGARLTMHVLILDNILEIQLWKKTLPLILLLLLHNYNAIYNRNMLRWNSTITYRFLCLMNVNSTYTFHSFCISSLLFLVSSYFLQPFLSSVSLVCWHFIYLWSWHPWLTICQTAPLPNRFPLTHLRTLISVLAQLLVYSQGFCHAHLWIRLLSVFIQVVCLSCYILMVLI